MEHSDNTPRRREFTREERDDIYHQWLTGRTFAETADAYDTHRQTTRGIVLRLNPSPEDYRRHDYHLRTRLLRKQARRNSRGGHR